MKKARIISPEDEYIDMKVYLDTCCIQRPLDNKNQVRIILESEAILAILSLHEEKSIDLICSDILIFESERNPNITRREFALSILSKIRTNIKLNEDIEKRARTIHEEGIGPLDALHIASAEAAEVDYFCTCDDDLIKRTQTLKRITIKMITPLQLIEEMEKW